MRAAPSPGQLSPPVVGRAVALRMVVGVSPPRTSTVDSTGRPMVRGGEVTVVVVTSCGARVVEPGTVVVVVVVVVVVLSSFGVWGSLAEASSCGPRRAKAS